MFIEIQNYLIIIIYGGLFIIKGSQKLMSGLISCGNQWNQAHCIIKLIEAITSSILILYASYEIFKSIQEKFKFNFIFVLLVLITTTLTLNVTHSIWDERTLLILEILFANIFFLTILYYVGFNVLVVNWAKIILHCFFGLFLIFQLAVAIQNLININQNTCREIWYLVINSIAILISIILFSLYWQKQRSQQKFKDERIPGFHSPFKMMWVMILGNIFCSLVSLGQSVALEVGYSDTCKFSQVPVVYTQDQNNNAIINFIFTVTTYYLGLICALLTIRDIRMRKVNNEKILRSPSSYSNVDSGRGKLQLIVRESLDHSRSSSLD